MKFRILTLAMLVFLLGGTLAATAQNDQPDFRKQKPDMERPGEQDFRRHHQERWLTDEQRDLFKEIRLQTMKESKPLQDELRELEAHHKTLMTTEKPNMKEIYASIDKMGKVKSELAKIRAKSRIEMASHLTEEQKLKMAEFGEMRNGWNHDDRRPEHRHKQWRN